MPSRRTGSTFPTSKSPASSQTASANERQGWCRIHQLREIVNNMDREERRALLEQRRSAVAHQLRRLAIELMDLDRQLDDIEQSEGRGTPSALQGHTAEQ